MASFFQKARERAQEAAAQFQQPKESREGEQANNSRGIGNTINSSLPHILRHGMAAVDPRHEYNRSFHLLNDKLKALRIDHEAAARESKAVATSTCKWGQDHLPYKREDGVGDEALADMTDRLAYIFSLIGDLESQHGKRLEKSRSDLKRIQKAEMDLAPKRNARVKIHKELVTLIPERAKIESSKIAPLEAQQATLEREDKVQEEDLSKLKREALKSSYDAHFDSMIELGEKMALVARYGKLMTAQLPIEAQPFPAPRISHRRSDEPSWPGEAQLDAIRAAVETALSACKPDHSLPPLPSMGSTASLSREQTVHYSETHKEELDSALKEEDTAQTGDRSVSSIDAGPSSSHLPMGGSLPPKLNFEPTFPPTSSDHADAGPPILPPRNANDINEAALSPSLGLSPSNTMVGEEPTLAETGSPIVSSAGGPGPLTGTLSPRVKSTSTTTSGGQHQPQSYFASSNEEKAQLEREEVQKGLVGARLRRDGTVVRRGDKDWQEAEQEDLPPYEG